MFREMIRIHKKLNRYKKWKDIALIKKLNAEPKRHFNLFGLQKYHFNCPNAKKVFETVKARQKRADKWHGCLYHYLYSDIVSIISPLSLFNLEANLSPTVTDLLEIMAHYFLPQMTFVAFSDVGSRSTTNHKGYSQCQK